MELEYLFSTCFIQNHQFQVYQVLPSAFSLVRRHHPSKRWPHVMCSSLKPPKSPMLRRLFCCHYWMGIVCNCSWNGFKLDPYLKPCKDDKFENLTLGNFERNSNPQGLNGCDRWLTQGWTTRWFTVRKHDLFHSPEFPTISTREPVDSAAYNSGVLNRTPPEVVGRGLPWFESKCWHFRGRGKKWSRGKI